MKPPMRHQLLGLFGSAIFVGIGIWMGLRGKPVGWGIAAFFGLGLPIFTIGLMPGSNELRLAQDGFTVRSLFRPSFTSWNDVTDFCVIKMKQHGLITVHSMVGYDYQEGYDRAKRGRAVSRFVAGCEAAVPDTYGLSAEDLADLLNAWRRSATGAA